MDARRKLESVVERKVVTWARQQGIEVTKLKMPENAGYPDRCFWLPGGYPLLIEFKRQGEEPRKLQRYIIKKLRKLGYIVYVTDNETHAKRVIGSCMEAASVSKEGDKVPARARRRRVTA